MRREELMSLYNNLIARIEKDCSFPIHEPNEDYDECGNVYISLSDRLILTAVRSTVTALSMERDNLEKCLEDSDKTIRRLQVEPYNIVRTFAEKLKTEYMSAKTEEIRMSTETLDALVYSYSNAGMFEKAMKKIYLPAWQKQIATTDEREVRKVNNLENYRKKAGLTQAELSKMTGIPECALSRVEKSVSDMNGARWKAVAEALGCSIDELLRVNRN